MDVQAENEGKPLKRKRTIAYVGIVAVVMPFSSVVTGFVAVAVGKESFGLPLLFGGLIILFSSILSSAADIRESRTAKIHLKEQLDDD